LRSALDSVLAQTYPHLEIVVTDDGSTDGSADILRGYELRGVRVIRQPNRGQCAAANAAYAASTGELVKFFDADDILDPEMIERQVNRLAGRSDAIAMGEWRRFYGARPNEAPFEQLPMYRNAKPVDWLVQEWSKARPMMQCALWLIPRPIIEARGVWNERLSLINDFEYFARLLLGSRDILYAPGARMHYRSGIGSSLSQQRSRKAVESAFLSLMAGTQHLLDVEDSARTRMVCANLFQDFDYTYYPAHPDLRARAQRRVAALDGADLAPDGPPAFQKLRRLTGWRVARLVQLFAERHGLNRAGRFGSPATEPERSA
jgi:glycosyltransferase involved in cell wall biosynthesis